MDLTLKRKWHMKIIEMAEVFSGFPILDEEMLEGRQAAPLAVVKPCAVCQA